MSQKKKQRSGTPCSKIFVRSSFCFQMIILYFGCLSFKTVETHTETKLKGHLQAFGESGTRGEIEIKYEFPKPYDFLVNYVQRLKPLKLPGVAKNSRAVCEWTDDYLLALDVPPDSVVQLETMKKENRTQDTTEMHFHDFLRIYNHTEHYMVDDVPPYLSPDVMVPCSLQCPELLEQGLAFAMMWFSSGGTKSVIHTDGFDNINCVLRGEKIFVMMDPARDREKIKLKTEGSYSDIDVDKVDLTVYPELADAEFYHVHVQAGDCLYIPYMWIHQVRSFNSNVAVNFWWDHYASTSLLEEKAGPVCQSDCDPDLSLDNIKLRREDPSLENHNAVRDWLRDVVLNNPFTLKDALNAMKSENDVDDLTVPGDKLVMEMFEKLDHDRDGKFTFEEYKKTPTETWKEVMRYIVALSVLLEDEEAAARREYAAHVEAERRDEL